MHLLLKLNLTTLHFCPYVQPFVDPVLYPLLTKALNGRPRHRELARAQMEVSWCMLQAVL